MYKSLTGFLHHVAIVLALLVPAVVISNALAALPTSGQWFHASAADSRVTAPRQISSATRQGALDLSRDGWHAWTVDAVEDAPNWCCATWKDERVDGKACDLDGSADGFTRASKRSVTGSMRIYVHMNSGRAESIRAYGSTCKVNSKRTVVEHGKVTADVSLQWLSTQLQPDRDRSGEAMAAIAVHDSVRAQQLLVDAAGSNQPLSFRKDAIFWMAQIRATQSLAALTNFMMSDPVDDIREHAVFAVSQTELPERVSLVEQVALRDGSPRVRGQAWFWLAQTNAPQAGQRIVAGIRSESDRGALEQAVFALSQLPGDEAADRLIEVVEQPDSARAVRKQALFWLAQDDSKRAVAYLASVLDP